MKIGGGLTSYGAGLSAAPFLYWFELFHSFPFILAALALPAARTRLFPVVMVLFLFLTGLSSYNVFISHDIPSELKKSLSSHQNIRIEGTIRTLNSRPENGLRIDLESVVVENGNGTIPVPGALRIYADIDNSDIAPGNRVRLMARLRPPRNFATPGGFDYVRYLQRRDIIATGYTEQTANLAVIADEVKESIINRIRRWRARLRQQILSNIDSESAPLVNALTTGDRGAITQQQRQLLAQSGLAHLFAISGLHIGLVAAFLYALCRYVYLAIPIGQHKPPPRRILPPLLVPFLFGYMILTGSAISTLRAFIMLVAIVLLCGMARRSRPFDILLVAAFIILVADPLSLFEPSFQLSFAGAAGIALLFPLWRHRLADKPLYLRYPLGLLAANLSATAATMPLVLMHFHILAPAGPLLNMLAIPLVSLIIVPIILVATLCQLFSAPLSLLLFKSAAVILSMFFTFCHTIVNSDYLNAVTIYSSSVEILVPIILAATLFLLYRATEQWRFVICGLSIFIAISAFAFQSPRPLTVTVLDVGQGDSTLLQFPNNKSYLVDGGGLYSDRFDIGEKVVAPALGALGIDRLEAVILTHDHPDHRKGLVYILKHFKVKEFWCGQSAEELHPDLEEVLNAKKIPYRQFEPGWQDLSTGTSLFKIFTIRTVRQKKNDQSLVLYAATGNDGVLLTSDLEKEGIRMLVSSAPPGPVNLLKIPHHGSRYSNPKPLLNTYAPGLSFISVGYNNRYKHPDPTMIEQIKKSSCRIDRTDLDGSIRYLTTGNGWAITHWKKGLFR